MSESGIPAWASWPVFSATSRSSACRLARSASGAPGEMKLKDYLIDKKVPRAQRDKLVLLACGGEVLAVLGMTVSVRACVDENTKNIAVIKVEVNNAGKGC